MTTGSNSDRSATGATLSASFTGATGTISETGFKYGTSSNIETLKSSGTTAANTGLSITSATGDISKAITGLSGNTEYYYVAYVKEYNESTSSVETRYATNVGTIKKIATASVSTNAASGIAQTTAVLNGSYTGATGVVDYTGFLWGTSSTNLDNDAMGSSTSSPFTATISGLTENTTYYFKAYVGEYNENTGSYEYRYGDVQSFKTQAAAVVAQGYLGCYEVPSVTVSGTGTTGYYNTSNDPRDDRWYRYNTNSSSRKVVTHTFTGSERVRNYTVLFDGDKHAPVWVAFPMHADVYGGTTSRSNAWRNDPGITTSGWQQTGLDNAESVGYSRGHFLASQYRKKNDAANLQTFYYSNQAPQWQNGFNSGVWSSLETQVLNSAPSGQSDTLYVVVGVLYEEDYYSAHSDFPRTLPSSGVNIPIPTHFYTCLMKCSFDSGGTMTNAKGIAFVYSNVSHSGDNYYKSEYISSIDEIEERAGFDFFPNVPSNLQATAETNIDARWFEPKASAPSSAPARRGHNWQPLRR